MSESKQPNTVATFPRIGLEISRGELYKLYWVDQLSQKEIAEYYDTTEKTIYRAFDKTDVPKRNQKSANELAVRKKKESREYTDKNKLKNLYYNDGKSIKDIASGFGVTGNTIRYWLKRHDIDTFEKRYDIPEFELSPTHTAPHPVWKGCDGQRIPVHQLVAIADGADPIKVFDGTAHNVHHKNGHPCDNRPENLEVLTVAEHGRKTMEQNRQYSESDMKSAIWMLLNASKYF